MTQDPYGQQPVTGNVVRGEVISDNEGNVVPPTVPMTRFEKVASVASGDRTDPAIPVGTADGSGVDGSGVDGSGPDGTAWPRASQTDPDARGAQRGRHAAIQTPAEDVVAVRSPDAGDSDWDDPDETEESGPGQTADQADPGATGTQDPVLDGETADPGADPGAGAGAGPSTDSADAAADEGPRPGEPELVLADPAAVTVERLLPDAAEFRTRWQQVQFRFVDDPRGSVIEAADVISQLTARLEAAIAERQRALRERWGEGSADTESLRGTLLMYRAFLDQLIGSDGR